MNLFPPYYTLIAQTKAPAEPKDGLSLSQLVCKDPSWKCVGGTINEQQF